MFIEIITTKLQIAYAKELGAFFPKKIIIFFYFSGIFSALRSLLFHNWCSGKLKPYCRIIYETKGFYLFPRERHQTVAVLWQFSSFVSRRFPLLELADLIGKRGLNRFLRVLFSLGRQCWRLFDTICRNRSPQNRLYKVCFVVTYFSL